MTGTTLPRGSYRSTQIGGSLGQKIAFSGDLSDHCRSFPRDAAVFAAANPVPSVNHRTRRELERLYIFGWLAMKFDGRPGREVPTFFKKHFNVTVSEDTVTRAVDPVRGRNTFKRSGTAAGPEIANDEAAIWTDWLCVDEARLGVRKVLVHVANDGYELPGLVGALERLPGIRQVILTKERREVFAIALLRREEDEDGLRAQILEHAPGHAVTLSAIRVESDRPTRAAWFALARAEASELGLDGGP